MEDARLETEINKDAGDRLVAMCPDAPWFHKAARLAGEQLEWLMPVAMGTARGGGLYAGKVVMGDPGWVVIVSAGEHKLCTVQFKIDAGGTAKQVFDDIAEQVEQRFPEVVFTVPFAASVMRGFINKFGAKPGNAHPKYPDGFGVTGTFNLLGPFLIALGVSGRASMTETVDSCFGAGICPAVVCLIGGSRQPGKGTYSFSALTLPLANYADCVLAHAALQEASA
jgi:hypothetical protein